MNRFVMPTRKDVLVFAKEKDYRLFIVAVDLKSSVRAMADIATRLEKARFNVLTGFISTPKADSVGRCSFLGEAHDPKLTASDIKRLMEGSSHVVGCEVQESHNGFIVDALNFPLTWNSGDRAFMLRTAFFGQMNAKIRALLGSGAEVMLYELGYEHGLPSWRNILAESKVKTQADLIEVLHFYSAVGWGKVEVVSFDLAAKKATIRMKDNFECGGLESRKPVSHFVRGHLAGAFATVFGGEVKLEETSCIAKGDAYCEFQVTA